MEVVLALAGLVILFVALALLAKDRKRAKNPRDGGADGAGAGSKTGSREEDGASGGHVAREPEKGSPGERGLPEDGGPEGREPLVSPEAAESGDGKNADGVGNGHLHIPDRLRPPRRPAPGSTTAPAPADWEAATAEDAIILSNDHRVAGWICPYCEAENGEADILFCRVCGKERLEDA